MLRRIKAVAVLAVVLQGILLIGVGQVHAAGPTVSLLLTRLSPADAGPYPVGTSVEYKAWTITIPGGQPVEASITLTVPGVGNNTTATGVVTVSGVTTEAGNLPVTATCTTASNSPVNMSLPVVRTENIELKGGNVDGTTKVVLKGVKYQLKALKFPAGVAWPANQPVWTSNPGLVETMGVETVNVTFAYGPGDGETVAATCGTSSKTATSNVILPQIKKIVYSGATNYPCADGTNSWIAGTATNDPGCFKKSAPTGVQVWFDHAQTLSYSTQVKVKGEPAEADRPTTGGNYEATCTFGTSWTSPVGTIGSASNTVAAVLADAVNIDWDVRVDSPDGDGYYRDAGNSNGLAYYVIYDSPKCDAANFTCSNLQGAVGKVGANKTTEAQIASSANDNVGSLVLDEGGCICESGFQVNFDGAMGTYPTSGKTGQCCCRAEGLNCVLQVLGIGPYTHVYVNEIAEPNENKGYYSFTCQTCGSCARAYWDSFWNAWEGAIRSGGAGTQCYAPANGGIPIDEGTYAQIRDSIAANIGFSWRYGKNHTDVCPHWQ